MANQKAVGVETEGTFSSVLPGVIQYRAPMHLVVYICQQYGIQVRNVLGHRDFSGNTTTKCCGNAFHPTLAVLHRDVTATLNAGWVITSDLSGGAGAGGSYPTLRTGSRGSAVTAAQVALKKNGLDPGVVDGVFGTRIETAVKAFQTQVKLTVDGKFGPSSALVVKSYQSALALQAHGVVGSGTWGALQGG